MQAIESNPTPGRPVRGLRPWRKALGIAAIALFAVPTVSAQAKFLGFIGGTGGQILQEGLEKPAEQILHAAVSPAPAPDPGQPPVPDLERMSPCPVNPKLCLTSSPLR